jgi:hypothetical protein
MYALTGTTLVAEDGSGNTVVIENQWRRVIMIISARS